MQKILSRKIIVILTLCFACGIPAKNEAGKQKPQEIFQANGHWKITFFNARDKKETTLQCEVAISERQKATGLMFRKNLPKDRCMIFVYDQPQVMNFWMKSTAIPLSIAFVSENLTILEMYDMQPHDEAIISSNTSAMYAVEVNRGWFKQHSVFNSSKMKIEKFPDQPLSIITE